MLPRSHLKKAGRGEVNRTENPPHSVSSLWCNSSTTLNTGILEIMAIITYNITVTEKVGGLVFACHLQGTVYFLTLNSLSGMISL